MPEGEEAVKSVFGVEVVVGPVAVEAAFGGQSVSMKSRHFSRSLGQVAFEAGQRVQCGGGGKQVGQRRLGIARKPPSGCACASSQSPTLGFIGIPS